MGRVSLSPERGQQTKVGWESVFSRCVTSSLSRTLFGTRPKLPLMIIERCICAFDWYQDGWFGWHWTAV